MTYQVSCATTRRKRNYANHAKRDQYRDLAPETALDEDHIYFIIYVFLDLLVCVFLCLLFSFRDTA
jgi:hypothetical protein